jgi:hypothetical protein
VDCEVIPSLAGLLRTAIEVGRPQADPLTIPVASAGGQIVNLLDIGKALAAKGLG